MTTYKKEKVGGRKVPLSLVSGLVLSELAVAMHEGALKYGRHNYRRSNIKGSTYYDACQRHLMRWWEGENLDLECGISHVTKAIASLVVLRDAMLTDNWHDDRPARTPNMRWAQELDYLTNVLTNRYEHLPDSTETKEGDSNGKPK